MRPEVAQAEDAVQARAESNLSWHLHRMDTAWAKSVRPRIAHAPDRYFANGNLAPGVLMRRGCQWYLARRACTVSKRRTSDRLPFCGVLLWSAASDVCGGPAALAPTNHSSSESAAAMRVTRSTTSNFAAERPATDRSTSRLTTHFPSKMILSRSFDASRPLTRHPK